MTIEIEHILPIDYMNDRILLITAKGHTHRTITFWYLAIDYLLPMKKLLVISPRIEHLLFNSNPEYIKAKNLILEKFYEYHLNLNNNEISMSIYDYRN